jgi:pimeloyl-ACP methyl ester carboxylesterase
MPQDGHTKTGISRVEGDAVVHDILLNGIPVFIVEPAKGDERALVLFLHWVSSDGGDRTQFLQEAIDLAGLGVVSALPQGDFPWNSEPTSSSEDVRRIQLEVARYAAVANELRSGLRIDLPFAIVGHDFGGMYGSLLARMFKPTTIVLVSATPRWADWFLAFWPIKEDRFAYLRAMNSVDPITQVAALATTPSLFQFGDRDFFIAEMTAREFQEAAGPQSKLLLYESDHALDLPQARQERREFLLEHLGLVNSEPTAEGAPTA